MGNRESVVKIQKILDEMDVKAPQVALSTVIGELTLNNDEEFGIDYFFDAISNDASSGGRGCRWRHSALTIVVQRHANRRKCVRSLQPD